jgi:nicotinamide riboside transporter PnuC
MLAMTLVIGAYGLLAIVGAIGAWRQSPRAWTLVVVIDLVGLVIITWTRSLADALDGVLLTGIVIWGLAVLLVLAPPTRAALRR